MDVYKCVLIFGARSKLWAVNANIRAAANTVVCGDSLVIGVESRIAYEQGFYNPAGSLVYKMFVLEADDLTDL